LQPVQEKSGASAPLFFFLAQECVSADFGARIFLQERQTTSRIGVASYPMADFYVAGSAHGCSAHASLETQLFPRILVQLYNGPGRT
jgi:hypothetical protein